MLLDRAKFQGRVMSRINRLLIIGCVASRAYAPADDLETRTVPVRPSDPKIDCAGRSARTGGSSEVLL